MHPVERYLAELRDDHATGSATRETSYYPALRELLNEVGKKLKPKVRCLINPASKGAGIPDGGLFTSEQFRRAKDDDPRTGQLPARGALEVKGPEQDVEATADTEQVAKYLRKYRQVFVTNYRDFLLVGRDKSGNPVQLERYTLAESAKEFWQMARHPRKAADEAGDRLLDYLRRVMLHAADLADPEDVAWFLASYAREALARIESREFPALATIRKALEEALGLTFEGEKGEHFFRSTLVQTLFYGVFSAWVLWCRKNPPGKGRARFNWHEAEWSLRVPMIRTLYRQVASPRRLESMHLVEVLDWTGALLNRVDRAAFFERFEQERAVQYFYEPFLKAFDPALRKQLGVWYTPPEVVQYMVARVDTVLREELDVADGLADPNVFVLDPCCGTGAFLVEVLKRIDNTLREKGGDALTASDLKQAAMERVFGFEILPAPFVVAHLQLGLMLQTLGAPLSEKGSERVGVYLTNALTGWEPPTGEKQHLAFPELEEERDAADEVKQEKPILVVLGNPPYNAFAGVSPTEEKGLVDPYKEGLISKWGIKKFNLDELYVRFFRLAEQRITEKTGRGIVSFITNFSYLADPSFVVMRNRFVDEFDSLWFDCMNGDSRETGKITLDGKPDPSVFSTPQNKEGIRVGTAICVMVRKEARAKRPKIRFRHFWGTSKRSDLIDSLGAKRFNSRYSLVSSAEANRHSFRPEAVTDEYRAWPSLPELSAIPPANGLMEKRGGALISIDEKALAKWMKAYLNGTLDWDDYCALGYGLTQKYARFDPKAARKKLIAHEKKFIPSRIVRYAVRPFDIRYGYYTPIRPIWNEPRPALWSQFWEGNRYLMTRPAGVASPEGVPFHYTRALGDNDSLKGHAYYIPLHVRYDEHLGKRAQVALFDSVGTMEVKGKTFANLSKRVRYFIKSLGLTNPDKNFEVGEIVWMHALAIGHSPAYLNENADGIRQDWPRIPLPNSKTLLKASAKLGQEVAALLDTESPVKGVNEGRIRPELKPMGVLNIHDKKSVDPDAGDLAVTAGWGHAGQRGVVMPARGKTVRREYTQAERDAVAKGAAKRGLSPDEALACLGESVLDVYLNGRTYWTCVPERVWAYTIGGYQVIKKWLSYREQPLLGRDLTPDEARHVTGMIRRIAAILLLQPSLDANYEAVKKNTYPWSQ